MLEIHYDKRGELAIENLADLMQAYPQYAKRATKAALTGEGYRLRNIIKHAMQTGPSTLGWPVLNPHTGILAKRKGRGGFYVQVKNFRVRRKKGGIRVNEYRQQMLSAKSLPMLRQAGAVRYQYDDQLDMVRIGFVNQTRRIAGLILRHAEGFENIVTDKVRKMLFALGFPIKKSTTRLVTPKRPVIAPIFEREKDAMGRNLRQQYLDAIGRYMMRQK